MPSIFISYSRRRTEIVRTLIEDIEALGHTVWYDKELTGGKPWWDGILAQIRSCDVFVLAVSPETLDSKACKREWRYAADLGKSILPVLITPDVTPDGLPARLQAIQSVDYRNLDRAAGLGLARAFNAVPASAPLPEPLPPPPEVPISDLATLRDLIDSDIALTESQQTEIVAKLRRLTRDPATSVDAFNLLRAMKARRGILAETDDDIDELLKAAPSGVANVSAPRPQTPVLEMKAPSPDKKAIKDLDEATPPHPVAAPVTWGRRLRFALAGAVIGGAIGALVVATLRELYQGLNDPDLNLWTILHAACFSMCWAIGAGRPRRILLSFATGIVAAIATAVVTSLGSMPSTDVAAFSLIVFLPLGWVVGAILPWLYAFLMPGKVAAPSRSN
jgi:hypothetical protein